MALSKRSPCSACVRNWTEFLRILDPGDVGITIFRYRGPARDEMGQSDKTRETFIFYTTKKVSEPFEEMGLDIYTAKYPECVNYCPRCKEMMRRIETLFKNSPSALDTEICELFSCPPCTDIVHKFRKFTAEDFLIKEHDSELIHLQRLTSPSDDDAFGKARTKFEDLVKVGASSSGDSEQMKVEIVNKEGSGGIKKDKELKKKETTQDKERKKKETTHDKELKKKESTHDKELKKKETTHDKERKTKTSKLNISSEKDSKEVAEMFKDDRDLKNKSTEDQKSPGKGSKDKARKINDASTRDKLSSKNKFGKSSHDIKKEKNSKRDNGKGEARTGTEDDRPMRSKINELLKQQDQQERAHKAQGQQLKKDRLGIDDKLNKAAKIGEEEKRARAEAEEARQVKLRQALMLAGPHIEESPESVTRTDVCSDDTAADYMIKGERICKASKEEREEKQVELVAVPPETTASTEFAAPPPTMNNDDMSPQHAKERKISGISYILSDRKYVENGWTQLPKEMVMERVTLFHMYPPRNNFDWLEMNRHKGRVLYDSGEQLATFDENCRARVYYRSGVVALDFYQAEDELAGGYRVVVYNNSSPLERRALPTVLAVFDYNGNGAVFDHTGQPRLKYTQNEGVVLDRGIGPYTHWKWHNLSYSVGLQTVLIDNEPKEKDQEIIRLAEEESHKDDKSSRKAVSGSRGGSRGDKSSKVVSASGSSRDKSSNKAVRSETRSVADQGTVQSFSNDEATMRNIETQKIIKENRLKRFLPYQIKMKAFKINENFSLRIIDQTSVYLSFTDGKTRLKLNVGMIMDPTIVLGQDLVEVGEVGSCIERVPASESVDQLQRVVKGARAAERARVLREHRLNPPVSSDLSSLKNKRRTN